jgi:hypothetical protein
VQRKVHRVPRVFHSSSDASNVSARRSCDELAPACLSIPQGPDESQ